MNLKGWIKGIQSCFPGKNAVDHEYRNLVIRIIGFSSMKNFKESSLSLTQNRQTNENVLIGSDLGLTSEGTPSNNCFIIWKKDQLAVMQWEKTHVILNGDFGSGKTFLLKVRTENFISKHLINIPCTLQSCTFFKYVICTT